MRLLNFSLKRKIISQGSFESVESSTATWMQSFCTLSVMYKPAELATNGSGSTLGTAHIISIKCCHPCSRQQRVQGDPMLQPGMPGLDCGADTKISRKPTSIVVIWQRMTLQPHWLSQQQLFKSNLNEKAGKNRIRESNQLWHKTAFRRLFGMRIWMNFLSFLFSVI